MIFNTRKSSSQLVVGVQVDCTYNFIIHTKSFSILHSYRSAFFHKKDMSRRVDLGRFRAAVISECR